MNIILLVTVAVALYTDLRWGKVYNYLTFPVIGVGLIVNSYFYHFQGLLLSAEGMLLGVGLLLIPFLLRGMGAGDVKLLAAIGALKGPSFVFWTVIYSGLAGGLIALIILVKRGGLRKITQYLYGRFLLKLPVPFPFSSPMKSKFPYTLAIFSGTLAALIIREGLLR